MVNAKILGRFRGLTQVDIISSDFQMGLEGYGTNLGNHKLSWTYVKYFHAQLDPCQ